jgi:ribonuclease PH
MTRILHSSVRLLAIGVMAAAMTLPAHAQSVPNWNVKLPANPGTSSQTVALASGVLSVERVFPQNTTQFSVPLNQIAAISQPYLYKTNWLIDLKLSKKTTMVNTLNVGMVDRSPVAEVSLLFMNRADAAQARAYLMAHLRA